MQANQSFKDPTPVNLGFANGWIVRPKIVEDCKCKWSKGGKRSENIGNCLTRISCEKCGYTYKVDSSG